MTKLILMIVLILFQYLSRERRGWEVSKQNRESGKQDQQNQQDQRRLCSATSRGQWWAELKRASCASSSRCPSCGRGCGGPTLRRAPAGRHTAQRRGPRGQGAAGPTGGRSESCRGFRRGPSRLRARFSAEFRRGGGRRNRRWWRRKADSGRFGATQDGSTLGKVERNGQVPRPMTEIDE